MKKGLRVLFLCSVFMVYPQQKIYKEVTFAKDGAPLTVVRDILKLPCVIDQRGTKAGILDTTFAGKGIIKQSFLTADFDIARALVVQPDNAVVVAGYTGEPIDGKWQICLVRYMPYGMLDTSFGRGGTVIQQWSSIGYDQFNALVLQPNGCLLAAGATLVTVGHYKYLLARYMPSGILDVTFGGGGVVLQPFIGSDFCDEISALALQKDGCILAAGISKDGGGQKISLIRYTCHGILDETFGIGGIILQPFLGTQQVDMANAIAVQEDGSIVVVGSSSDQGVGKVKAVVMRYTATGILDASFGMSGKAIQPFMGTGNNDQLNSVVLQPDGSIVVAGFSSIVGGSKILLMRYTPAGILDQTFGDKGVVIQDFIGAEITENVANSLVLQPDGKIIVVGKTEINGDPQCVLLRYYSSGVLDPTFGNQGILVQQDLGTGNGDELLAVGLQSDGKIVSAGYTQDEGGAKMLVMRHVNNTDLVLYHAQHPGQGGFY